jgi:hypothetical protein
MDEYMVEHVCATWNGRRMLENVGVAWMCRVVKKYGCRMDV